MQEYLPHHMHAWMHEGVPTWQACILQCIFAGICNLNLILQLNLSRHPHAISYPIAFNMAGRIPLAAAFGGLILAGRRWPAVTEITGCPESCMGLIRRLCPNLQSLSVLCDRPALTRSSIACLEALAALTALRMTADRDRSGAVKELLYDDAYAGIRALTGLRVLQVEFKRPDMSNELSDDLWACERFLNGLPALTHARLSWGQDACEVIEFDECTGLRSLTFTGVAGVEDAYMAMTLEHLQEHPLPNLTHLCFSNAPFFRHSLQQPLQGLGLAGCTALCSLLLPHAQLTQEELEDLARSAPQLQALALHSYHAAANCQAVFPQLQRLACGFRASNMLRLDRLAPLLTSLEINRTLDGLPSLLVGSDLVLRTVIFSIDLAQVTAFLVDFCRAIRGPSVSVLVTSSLDWNNPSHVGAFKTLCRCTKEFFALKHGAVGFCSRTDADKFVGLAVTDASPLLTGLHVTYADARSTSAMKRIIFGIMAFQDLRSIEIQEGYADGDNWVAGRACMTDADLELLVEPKAWHQSGDEHRLKRWPRGSPPSVTLVGVRGVSNVCVQRLERKYLALAIRRKRAPDWVY